MYRVFLCCLLLGCVQSDSDIPGKETGIIFVYVETGLPVNDTCENCTVKCCPENQVIVQYANGSEICEDNVTGVKLQDIKVDIYSKDFKKTLKTGNTLKKFRFVHSEYFNYLDRTYPFEESDVQKLYLLETGEIVLRQLNYLLQWTEPLSYDKFCFDLQVNTEDDGAVSAGSEQLVFKIRFSDDGGYETAKKKDIVSAGAMVISCGFLLLVLVVYAVLPEKRNLPSLMLMTYVSCLFTAFLFTAVQVFTYGELEKNECIAIGLIVYYTLLASFTWMNVMSYDMWSTACKFRSIHWDRGNVVAKFGWYSIYGFGAPLLTTLFFVGIDYADLTSMPDFIKPHYVNSDSGSCYFESENERRLYVNAPILVTTVINIVFFVMTAMFIWRHSAKPGGTGDSRNTKKDQNRFLIYAKLTLVMGMNWILDVLGAVISPESWVWYLPDVFNSLIGLFIFIIFICKKDIFVLLCKRFSIKSELARQWGESTLDTSVSVSITESFSTPPESEKTQQA